MFLQNRQKNRLMAVMENLAAQAALQGNPEGEYVLYEDLPLSALRTSAVPPSLDGDGVIFAAVLCLDRKVLLAALPGFRDSEEPAPQALLDCLQASGLLLLEDCLARFRVFRNTSPGQAAQYLLRAGAAGFWEHSAWSCRPVAVPPDLWPLLADRQMLNGRKSPAVTPYGRACGLVRLRRFRVPAATAGSGQCPRKEGLCCSPADWPRLWGPSNAAPDWEVLPLKERLERMRKYGGCNPGHFRASVLRLMNMSLTQYIDLPVQGYPDQFSPGSKNESRQQIIRGMFREKFGDPDGKTFLDGLREIARLMDDPRAWSEGRRCLDTFLFPLRVCCKFRRSPIEIRVKKEECL